MKQKIFIFKSLLVSGFVLVFLMVASEGQAGPQQTIPSEKSKKDNSGVENDHKSERITQKELNDIKFLTSSKLGLRLAGALKSGNEYAYALIVEETTGKQNLYGIGDSIKGMKLLRIDKESVVLGGEGKHHVLKLTGGNDTVLATSGKPMFLGHVSNMTGLPFDENVLEEDPSIFEPVFNETGPIVGEDVSEEEISFFEPVFNDTGPPLDPEGVYEDLPEFVPVFNDSGPPAE